MTKLNKGDKKLLADIKEFGWHVLKVMEDDKGPGFCYSVGLYDTFNHPEIIIVGLKLDLAHLLINNIGEDIKNGLTYKSGEFYSDILDNFNCLLLEVSKDKYEEYFGYGLWFYKDIEFPVLQCIYPTVKGIFPWEDGWPEDLIELQPILGDLSEIEKE